MEFNTLPMTWKKSFYTSLSNLIINLSSGWFGAIIIVPNFSPIKNYSDLFVLGYDILFGSLFFSLSVYIGKKFL